MSLIESKGIFIIMKFYLFCWFFAMFLAMTVFLALESEGFTAGMGANIPGKKRSELKVRDT